MKVSKNNNEEENKLGTGEGHNNTYIHKARNHWEQHPGGGTEQAG
jgi:hypothetical protein